MIIRNAWRVGALLAVASATIGDAARSAPQRPSPAATSPTKRLPIATFAKLPFIERPAMSLDGTAMAGLAGVNGRQVIAIFDLFKPVEPVVIGLPDGVEAQSVRWANDHVVIVGLVTLIPILGQQIYVSRSLAIDTKTGKTTKLLWNLKGQNGGDVLWTPPAGGDEVLIAAQNSVYLDENFWPAVYRVNVVTGRFTRLIGGVEGVNQWSVDDRGVVRAGIGYNDGARTFRLMYRASASDSFRKIAAANSRKREVLLRPFLFLPDGNHALVVHDDDKGRSAIYETDLLTQKDARTVFEMPDGPGEVSSPILSDDGATLLGVTGTDADESIHWIDPDLATLQTQFDKAVPNARVRIVSFSRDRQSMLVRVGAADMPGTLYYYNVGNGRLQKIAHINSDVGARHLAPVRLVKYRARDGLEIEAVLTLPARAEGAKDARNLPFIIMPHGGPWAQDTLSYDYWAQFLADRGYAVLQPNFRGSTGYGTEFLHRGEGQMGLAMQDDVTDGVAWAVEQHIADPKRVCIVGASYGGYATMWGIAKTPDLYRCAISIAGVSSLRREVNDFGDSIYGGKFKDDWQRMTPDFNAVSPFNAVDRIKTPLLLIHGKKDITVDVSQSSRMFGRMRGAGKTVDYVPLPLADHFFTREADRTALLGAMETFLDKYNPAG